MKILFCAITIMMATIPVFSQLEKPTQNITETTNFTLEDIGYIEYVVLWDEFGSDGFIYYIEKTYPTQLFLQNMEATNRGNYVLSYGLTLKSGESVIGATRRFKVKKGEESPEKEEETTPLVYPRTWKRVYKI